MRRGAWAAVAALLLIVLAPVVALGAFAPAGPPFPDPQEDRAVYDQAGVFEAATIERAEQIIDAIEERTGAEVVVYSQVVDWSITEEEAESHARSLMDQWGVGRKGFDDGLVILFDLDPSLVHGQVQLYAGPGYRAAFLTNEERQAIFEDDMLPRLRAEDLDGALLVALEKVDANATPEHAARLQSARQLDAVLGLVGAPIVFVLVAGWAVASWWRYGKDPVYLDSPSIHLPAPPPDLTAASGALVLDGRVSRRALTTALLDLASRGLLAFREEKAMLGLQTKVGIETAVPDADPATEAQRYRNSRRPISKAEEHVLSRLRSIGTDGYIEPEQILEFGKSVETFNERLENHAVRQGWFAERPAKVTERWIGRAILFGILGAVGLIIGFNLPSNGILLIGAAALAGGVVVAVLAAAMPAVTMPGAMIRAMLFAYRRTLEKTMAQARSMQQVVDEAKLDWLDTPDQAVVWGLALGLEDEVEGVLKRTLDDVKDGRAVAGTYVPAWYHGGGAASGGGDGRFGSTGGLLSSGSLPNFGAMMGALGTIGNSPSSSGSGGGFGGGGSGGGGGGAGGGF
jgi:uncharacterized membrane protein YgcG